MTRNRYIATDTSKAIEVIKRHDLNGNVAGGFMGFEGGPRFTACFNQAVGRAMAQELAEVFGGTITWSLTSEKASSQRASDR